MISRLIRDPLLHFLTIGLALFLAYGWLAPDEHAEDEIWVSESALLEFIQFRSRQFDESRAREKLSNMAPDEYERMVSDFIREEALYREALALGLDDGDYIFKRRLVQKMEYLLSGTTEDPANANDEALEAYLAENTERYSRPARYTFTHIFFGGEEATQQARQLLAAFKDDAPAFDAAGQYGDLFPYHRNYVDRPADYIASQFGVAWPDHLDKLDLDIWQGPFASELGQHLVLLTERVSGGIPTLDDIRSIITRDYVSERRQGQQEAAIHDLISRYAIRREGAQP